MEVMRFMMVFTLLEMMEAKASIVPVRISPVSYTHLLLREGYYDYVGTDFHKLSEYEKGLRTLRLSGEQVRLVRKLLDNNAMLLK